MLMEKERQEIVDYGKKMSSAGLSKGTSGNISAYDPVCVVIWRFHHPDWIILKPLPRILSYWI